MLASQLDSDQVGKSLSSSCPFCGCAFTLKITPELINRISAPRKAKATSSMEETYVPGKEKYGKNGNGHDATLAYGEPSSDAQTDVLTLIPIENNGARLGNVKITQEFNIIGKKNNSGIAHQADIEIPTADPYMSRKHCLIRHRGFKLFSIQDKGSTNGTWLNGKKMDPEEIVYLENGDVIRLGHTEFKVSL